MRLEPAAMFVIILSACGGMSSTPNAAARACGFEEECAKVSTASACAGACACSVVDPCVIHGDNNACPSDFECHPCGEGCRDLAAEPVRDMAAPAD